MKHVIKECVAHTGILLSWTKLRPIKAIQNLSPNKNIIFQIIQKGSTGWHSSTQNTMSGIISLTQLISLITHSTNPTHTVSISKIRHNRLLNFSNIGMLAV